MRREPRGASARGFFVGVLSIGSSGQKLRVAFDTASGQVVLPASTCGSSSCLEHLQYAPQMSSTAVDVNAEGKPIVAQADEAARGVASRDGREEALVPTMRDAISIGLSSMGLGDGHLVGDLVRDDVCLAGAPGGRPLCAKVGVVAATEMTDAPFRAMPHDGIVGLGLAGLALAPAFSFLGQASAGERGLPPRFGLFHGEHTGELALGGHNPARLAGTLEWAPVLAPEEGYWQLGVRSVRIGNHTLRGCEDGKCRAIFDTCASEIGVPAAWHAEMQEALDGGRGHGEACSGPELVFDLTSGASLTLRANEYRERGPGGAAPCGEPLLVPLDLPKEFDGAFLLGEPVFRRYYLAFDASAPPFLGFGPAAAPLVEEEEFDPEESRLAALGEKVLQGATKRRQAGGGDFVMDGFGESTDLASFILQAVAMQVVLALALFCVGAHTPDGGPSSVVARLTGAVAKYGSLFQVSGLTRRLRPEEAVPQPDECVICLGGCEEDAAHTGHPQKRARPHWCRLRCGHHFHEQCVLEWLWKVQRCPVCRAHLLDSPVAPAAASAAPVPAQPFPGDPLAPA